MTGGKVSFIFLPKLPSLIYFLVSELVTGSQGKKHLDLKWNYESCVICQYVHHSLSLLFVQPSRSIIWWVSQLFVCIWKSENHYLSASFTHPIKREWLWVFQKVPFFSIHASCLHPKVWKISQILQQTDSRHNVDRSKRKVTES